MTDLHDMLNALLPDEGFHDNGLKRHAMLWLIQHAYETGRGAADDAPTYSYEPPDIADIPPHKNPDGLTDYVYVKNGVAMVDTTFTPPAQVTRGTMVEWDGTPIDAVNPYTIDLDTAALVKAHEASTKAMLGEAGDPYHRGTGPDDWSAAAAMGHRPKPDTVQYSMDRAFRRSQSPVANDVPAWKAMTGLDINGNRIIDASEPPALLNILDKGDDDKPVIGISELKHKVKLI